MGVALAVLALGACTPDPVPSGDPDLVDPGVATVLVTTGDGRHLLEVRDPVPLVVGAPAEPEVEADVVIDVDATDRYQTFLGVGGAMTGSAAHVLTDRLDPTIRRQVVNDLFSRRGAGMSVVRVPLSSTDFSLDDHTYDDVEPPGTDPELAGFSLAVDDTEVVPLLSAAASVNPDLTLIGSSWTAPGWMKTGASADRAGVIGGTLAPEWSDTYARYLARAASEYAERGLPLDLMTVQNEPEHEPTSYAGMFLSTRQEADLAAALRRELDAAGQATGVVVHDHNWSTAARAIEVLTDPVAAPNVVGTAFHCYRGDPSAQSLVHEAAPDRDVFFTECTGTEALGSFESNLLWNSRVLLTGAVRHWARTVVLWNLALDESSGPRVGGCGNCRGVLTIHPDGHVTRNEEFYALAQFGRGVLPGATRIGSTAERDGVANVAFDNPDGTRAVLLTITAPDARRIRIVDGARSFSLDAPARSVVTVRWRP